MEIAIAAEIENDERNNEEGVDLDSLLRFIRGEEIAGVRISGIAPRPERGEMGSGLHELAVVLSSGTGLALATAIGGWLRTRRRAVTLTITSKVTGKSVTFKAHGPDSSQMLADFLESGSIK